MDWHVARRFPQNKNIWTLEHVQYFLLASRCQKICSFWWTVSGYSILLDQQNQNLSSRRFAGCSAGVWMWRNNLQRARLQQVAPLHDDNVCSIITSWALRPSLASDHQCSNHGSTDWFQRFGRLRLRLGDQQLPWWSHELAFRSLAGLHQRNDILSTPAMGRYDDGQWRTGDSRFALQVDRRYVGNSSGKKIWLGPCSGAYRITRFGNIEEWGTCRVSKCA